MATESVAEATPSHPAQGRQVVDVDVRRDRRWDAFLVGARGATPFHLSGWLRALEVESGQRPIALACEEPNGQLVGVLPLQRTRGLPFGVGPRTLGARLSSLPRSPVAGPVAIDDHALRLLVAAAAARAERLGARLQLKLEQPILDGVAPGLAATAWRDTYRKELPAEPDGLRFGNSRNHARIRWAVAKAQREGVSIRPAADEDDLRAWYETYLEVNRWRGLPSRPYRLIRTAWRHLAPGGHLRLLLAERSRPGQARPELLAGALLMRLGGTTHYVFNGRRQESLSLRPNDLLQWQAMHDATEGGDRWYDFGEVDHSNEGLAGFKSKWGTERHALVRYHLPAVEDDTAGYGQVDGDEGLLRRAALAAWHRMPLGVTALAGDAVYRFL